MLCSRKFMENLPDAELRWIEDCGHVPHLEQSKVTAATIKEFLQSEELATPESSLEFPLTGAIAAAGLVGAVAALAGSF